MKGNAVGKRNELQRLLAGGIATVRGRELLVDRASSARPKLIQQCWSQGGCEGDDVHIRALDCNPIKPIGPRPQNCLSGGAPRFFVGANYAQFVLVVELVVNPSVVLIAIDVLSISIRQIESTHATREPYQPRVQTIR